MLNCANRKHMFNGLWIKWNLQGVTIPSRETLCFLNKYLDVRPLVFYRDLTTLPGCTRGMLLHCMPFFVRCLNHICPAGIRLKFCRDDPASAPVHDVSARRARWPRPACTCHRSGASHMHMRSPGPPQNLRDGSNHGGQWTGATTEFWAATCEITSSPR
jgi:hypothetical protein